MITIGLTGGIGSGKSTVSLMLKTAGFEIIDADIIARDVLKKYPEILEKVKNSRFFPNVLFIADKMVLREYISGENLGSYLYKHGLSYNIAVEIIELVEEFKKLNFTRINIRSAHIFIDSNAKLKVIDPRKPYIKNTPYPKDIIHVLVKLELFDDFLKYVAKYNPSLLKYWSLGYDYYIKMSKKKYFIKLKIC